MPDVEDFTAFVHSQQKRLSEKNHHFLHNHGAYSHWIWNPDDATLTFRESGRPTLSIDVTLVGTTVEDSWEWSWGNPNVSEQLRMGMDQVRKFGLEHGYEKLSTPFLTCDADTGQEMTAVAAHILSAQGSYRFSTGESCCYLIYRSVREIHETAPAPQDVVCPSEVATGEALAPLPIFKNCHDSK